MINKSARNWEVESCKIVLNENHLRRVLRYYLRYYQWVGESMGEAHNPFGAGLDDRITLEQVRREHPDVRVRTLEYDNILRQQPLPMLTEHLLCYTRLVTSRLAKAVFPPGFDLGLESQLRALSFLGG